MNKPKVTIFLDYDGVFVMTYGYEVIKRYESSRENKWDYGVNLIYSDRGKPRKYQNLQMVNIVNIHWLNKLTEEFDIDVAISSTHRYYMKSIIDMQYSIDQAGLKMKVIGKIKRNDKSRGCQIRDYIKENNIGNNYIIIDDDSDMTRKQKKKHFIQTKVFNGFTWYSLDKARKTINKLLKIKGDKNE